MTALRRINQLHHPAQLQEAEALPLVNTRRSAPFVMQAPPELPFHPISSRCSWLMGPVYSDDLL